MTNEKQSFIVDFWERIFYFLSFISVFYWVRKIIKSDPHRFVDFWVLGHLIGAIFISWLVFEGILWGGFLYIVFGYSFLRVFEIIVYQLNVLLFDQYRKTKEEEGYRIHSAVRMVILLLHNYIEIIFWFTTMILCLSFLYNYPIPISWGEFVKSNVLCITTFNSEALSSSGVISLSRISKLVFYEILSGLIMTLLSLARFISLLPPIKEMK